MSEREFWLGFSAMPSMGPAKFKKLLKEFGSAQKSWESISLARSHLARLVGEDFLRRFEKFREQFDIEDYLEKLKEKNVWFLTLEDKEYPEILRSIPNPPFVIYGKGSKEILKQVQDDKGGIAVVGTRKTTQAQHHLEGGRTIAVVGTRKTTEYGRKVTRILTGQLAASGFTIVSGLALGVDAVSHMTALENGGRTIAVLGCGVDCCCPEENSNLYKEILKSGNCIVSEFPLGMRPTKWSFPARNRIIAGLSQAVLVTEGAEDSGSLITAEFGLKFGKKVFAVPGPIISEMSKGPYKLIAKGAKLVTSAEDIMQSITGTKGATGIKGRKSIKSIKGDTKDEQKVLDLLEDESLHFDEVVRKSGLNSSKLSSLLSVMEIKGLVTSGADGKFSSVQ